MALRKIDAPPVDDLSYLCSRQYEDYLDWLENQSRPPGDFLRTLRKLAGALVGVGAGIGAAILVTFH